MLRPLKAKADVGDDPFQVLDEYLRSRQRVLNCAMEGLASKVGGTPP